MINVVVLTGRLTRDPELRKTTTGKSRTFFTLAVDRRFKGQDGGQDTDFISCVAWNRTAEMIQQYLHKGSLIGVEGRLSARSYDNAQGQRVFTTEVVVDNFTFLESKAQSEANRSRMNQGYGNDFGYGSSSYGQSSYGAPAQNPAPNNSAGYDQFLPDNNQYSDTVDLPDFDGMPDINEDDLPF